MLDDHLASEKMLQVPKKMLLYWRHYTFAIIGIFLFLGISIAWCTSRLLSLHEDKELLRKKLEYAKEKNKTPNMEEVRSKMEKLESKLEGVTSYLRERGVKNNGLEGGKGGESFELTLENVDEVLDSYGFYIDNIHHDLVGIPLGFPVKGVMTSGFGVRKNPFSGSGYEVHTGVDLKANKGDKVRSPANGKVVFAGWKGGYGNCVIIQHTHGYETLYGHLSKIEVKSGKQVKVGETIGLVGSTGRSTGAHLHYEISKQGKRLNAATFLKNN